MILFVEKFLLCAWAHKYFSFWIYLFEILFLNFFFTLRVMLIYISWIHQNDRSSFLIHTAILCVFLIGGLKQIVLKIINVQYLLILVIVFYCMLYHIFLSYYSRIICLCVFLGVITHCKLKLPF